MAIDMYRLEVLHGPADLSVATVLFLFSEPDDSRGKHWMTEEGRGRFIGTGQGKWLLLSGDRAVVLQDEAGYMPISRLDYDRWPWRKGDAGPMSYYGPGVTIGAAKFIYRVALAQ
jgi:hypothetical protein